MSERRGFAELQTNALSAPEGTSARGLWETIKSWQTAVESRWHSLKLTSQFALAAALVIGTGMLILGAWVASRIERGVIEHAAANSSLHLDSFVEPQLQALQSQKSLPPESERQLTALTLKSGTKQSIEAITIWGEDGTVIFSTIPRLAGERRLMPARVARAWTGGVEDKFEMVKPESTEAGRSVLEPVLRIYTPMHLTGTARILAVAEVQESAAQLAKNISKARMQTLGMFGLLSLAMLSSLMGIVRRGGQTIAAQKEALSSRVADLSAALSQNDELRNRVVEVNRRSADTNDRFLRRLGAELHDGPVQLIALALLRLEALKPASAPVKQDAAAEEDFAAVESALRDALKEIRGMSSGLSLPKMEGTTAGQVLEYAVRNHERRSRTRVKLELAADLPKQAPPIVLVCLYRFAQEALNNAFRYADGKNQAVKAFVEGNDVVVEISDGGPGMPENPPANEDDTKGLGLRGLKDRVESLDGRFEIKSTPGQGTLLRLQFDKAAFQSIDGRHP